MPVGGLDLDIAPYALENALRHSLNPIRNVSIAVPSREVERELRRRLEERHLDFGSVNLQFTLDIDLLESRVRDEIDRFPQHRRGWIVQQVVKIQLALAATTAGVLLLDADTLLLRRRLLLDNRGRGVLFPTYEAHRPYYDHLARALGPSYGDARRGWSHVSHHMVVQPSLLHDLIGELESRHGSSPLAAVVSLADSTEPSSCSLDYEMYAEWVLRRRRSRVRETKWGNVAVPRAEILRNGELRVDRVEALSRDYWSASAHQYLKEQLEAPR